MSDKLTFFEQNPVEHFRTLSKNILLSNKLTFASKKSRFCLTSQLEKQGKYKKTKKTQVDPSFLPCLSKNILIFSRHANMLFKTKAFSDKYWSVWRLSLDQNLFLIPKRLGEKLLLLLCRQEYIIRKISFACDFSNGLELG
jgi:hypothetical protein